MKILPVFVAALLTAPAVAQTSQVTNYFADAATQSGQLTMCTVVFEHFDQDPIGIIRGYSGSFGMMTTELGDLSLIAKVGAGIFADDSFEPHPLTSATIIGTATDTSKFVQFEDETDSGRLLLHQLVDADYSLLFITDMFAGPMLSVIGADPAHSTETALQPALQVAPNVVENYNKCVLRMMGQAERRLMER